MGRHRKLHLSRLLRHRRRSHCCHRSERPEHLRDPAPTRLRQHYPVRRSAHPRARSAFHPPLPRPSHRSGEFLQPGPAQHAAHRCCSFGRSGPASQPVRSDHRQLHTEAQRAVRPRCPGWLGPCVHGQRRSGRCAGFLAAVQLRHLRHRAGLVLLCHSDRH